MDRSHVGVGNVDGQDELRVHHRRLHLEGSELYRDQVEGRVLGLGGNDRRRSNRRRSSDEGGAPAPITLLLHVLRWRKEEEVGETQTLEKVKFNWRSYSLLRKVVKPKMVELTVIPLLARRDRGRWRVAFGKEEFCWIRDEIDGMRPQRSRGRPKPLLEGRRLTMILIILKQPH